MFDKTHNQINSCGWDKSCALGDEVDHTILGTTRPWKDYWTGEHFSGYCRDKLRVRSELPCCGQYKPGNLLVIGPLNQIEIIDDDDNHESLAVPGAPSGGGSRPGDGNDNDNNEG